jgi:hypothetical protein
MRRWLKNNSLSLVVFSLFLIFWFGQSVAGYQNYNEDQQEHQAEQTSYPAYLRTGAFIEATFENWESEYLQMAAYVLLTAFLFQKGSAESKKLQGSNESDRKPRSKAVSADAPGPVRRGGIVLKLYENSLSIALALLFLVSFLLHAYGGAIETSQENIQHGEESVGMVQYMTTSKFWFESFQNWQSEFLAVFSLAILSIWLRQKGSPESKPVSAPHAETGS